MPRSSHASPPIANLLLARLPAAAYRRLIPSLELVGSMGSIGDCYDNSLVESSGVRCSWNFSTPESGQLALRLPRPSSSG